MILCNSLTEIAKPYADLHGTTVREMRRPKTLPNGKRVRSHKNVSYAIKDATVVAIKMGFSVTRISKFFGYTGHWGALKNYVRQIGEMGCPAVQEEVETGMAQITLTEQTELFQ